MPDSIAATTSDAANEAEMASFITESNDVVSVEAPKTAKAAAVITAQPTEEVQTEEAEPTAHDAAAPPVSSAQERINKAVGKQRSAERETGAMQARAESSEAREKALEARLVALEKGLTKPEAVATVDPNEPNPKDFTYGELDKAYIAAITRYEIKKSRDEDAATAKKSQETAQMTEATSLFEERKTNLITIGDAKYENFQEAVFDKGLNAMPSWPLSPTLGALILESEYGHDIAYTLATDTKLAKDMDAMSPSNQAKWFGRLEAQFEAASPESQGAEKRVVPPKLAPVARKMTQAPAPLAFKNKGTGGNAAYDAALDDDFAAFEAQWKSRKQ